MVDTPAPAGDETLTPRELEVVALVVGGLSNAEIADALGISRRTAQAHVAAAARKLGVRTRTQLAVAALRRRLVALDSEDTYRNDE